jgi:hypothetical protein
MKATTLGWWVRAGSVALVATCAGCSFSVLATDGSETFSETASDPVLPALIDSGIRDLPCSPDKIHVTDLSGAEVRATRGAQTQFVETGCGFRVVYRVPDSGRYRRIELVSRSPLS